MTDSLQVNQHQIANRWATIKFNVGFVAKIKHAEPKPRSIVEETESFPNVHDCNTCSEEDLDTNTENQILQETYIFKHFQNALFYNLEKSQMACRNMCSYQEFKS